MTTIIAILTFILGFYLGRKKNKIFIGRNQKINQTYNDGDFSDDLNDYEKRKINYSEKEYKRLKKKLS